MKHLILLMLLAGAATLTRAADPTLSDLLSGRDVPLTHQLKDLDASWRRFSLGAGLANPASPSAAYLALLGGGGGSASYFTQGQVVRVHDEPFLIAYRLQTKPIDLQALMRGGARPDQLPKPEPPTATTTLSLTLIHLRTAGNLTDIQPFNLERELAGGDDSAAATAHARAEAAKAAGLDNLRQLGVALLAYAADGDKRLPPMDDLAATRTALQPYSNGQDLFGEPPYRADPALARKKLSEIEKPAATVVFYESQATNQTRGVLFLDGHVERIAEEKWTALKKTAAIP